MNECTWKTRKRWSDQFIPEIKDLVGRFLAPRLFVEAPIEEDQERNTDLVVLRMEPIRVACRVRDFGEYHPRFSREFTIRSRYPYPATTELEKVLAGWGDYIFYGFGVPGHPCQVVCWFIGDLRAFRGYWQWYTSQYGVAPGEEHRNTREDDSWFRAFNRDRIDSAVGQFTIAGRCLYGCG